jgi:hypothetical protein
MYTLFIITSIEIIYLVYMFFFFKTDLYIGPSIAESYMNKISQFFIHHTGNYESKICDLGRAFAIVAIGLSIVRLYIGLEKSRSWNIFFILFCLLLASILNLNALLYSIPLLFLELYIYYNFI